MSKNDASPIPKVRTRTAPKLPTEYAVGYKNPPKDTQFKKGQSGNPKGRKKGEKNTSAILAKLLSQKIPVREHGKTKTLSKREAALAQLVFKAVGGSLPAFKQLFDMEARLVAGGSSSQNADAERPTSPKEIAEEDKLILQAYMEIFNSKNQMKGGGDD